MEASGDAERRARTAAWLAWSLWGLVMIVFAAGLVLRLWNGSALTSSLEGADYFSEILLWDVLVPAAIPAYATVGAVVASRRPGNGVGWLCLALGTFIAVVEASWEYTARTFEVAPGSLPAGVLAAWVSVVLQPVMLLPFPLILLLFPDGRLPSRRWRPVAWAAVVIPVLGALGAAIGESLGVGLSTDVPNPTSIGSLGAVAEIAEFSFVAWAFLLLPAVASVFVRWRRAGGNERQQLKWLAYAGAIIGAGVVGGVASAYVSGVTYLTVFTIGVGVAGITICIPVAIGTAMLRHRLYDVDVLINRTLVYGALTVMLVLVYLGGVVGLQSLFRALTGEGSQLAVVASTLAIAALFNPLRRRIQAFIDRGFYRRKYDAAKTLESFGATLRDETDLHALNDDLVAVVRETMQPAHVSLWLRPDPGAQGGEVTTGEPRG
jgi:hypothetical protein